MSKKRTGLDTLGLDSALSAEKPLKTKVEKKAVVVKLPEIDKKTVEVKKTSIYIPQKAFDQLRELAFTEDKKMHDYFLEGLDRVFKHRGLKSLNDLT